MGGSMRPQSRRLLHAIVFGLALLVTLAGGGAAWARAPRRGGPGLWIVADRIVGFVPFTVYIYGRVLGSEPGQIELCRSEVSWLTESPATRMGSGRPALDTQHLGDDPEGPCASGRVVRTPDGFDYSHDMHFERPGVYHVSLTMVDAGGRRISSNTVQVNAF